jgi:hypothetical protein
LLETSAFTGAIVQKIGRLELADRGSLFLDEVGDLPLAVQPKLLRALQELEFERLGSGPLYPIAGLRTAAEEAGALRVLKPLEFDLRPISSLLATHALNPKGHLLVCTGATIKAQRASHVNDKN